MAVVVNQRTISFVIGLFTLFSLVAGTITVFNNYTYKIDALEQRNTDLLGQINELNVKIDKLSGEIVKLTIALNRIDDRTKAQ